MENEVLLKALHIKKYFSAPGSFFKKKIMRAVDDVSLEIYKGKTLALVGESGCGKSTLGKTIIGAIKATDGEVYFDGELLNEKTFEKHMTEMQMIFQDPLSSLNPRMTVYDIIAEPLRVCTKMSEDEIDKRVKHLMDVVGLHKRHTYRYPHEFSGGQCQRIGIARAMALNPKLIVCDEPVSALDVSIKAQIINMFSDIQKDTGVSYLFITHDLLTVKYVSHQIAVMYFGHIVELANTEELYEKPMHPYTQALLSAIAVPDVDSKLKRIELEGEVPSPVDIPPGCPFASRCRFATDECLKKNPELKDYGNGHLVACIKVEANI